MFTKKIRIEIIFIIFMAFLGSFQYAGAKGYTSNGTFRFNILPENLQELKTLKESRLNTPSATAALTVLALLQYPENREESIEMLTFLKGGIPLTNNELLFLRDRFMDKDYVPRSYFEGTSPENDYRLKKPYRIKVYENSYSYDQDGYAKLYIKSSGADTPRPIVLRKKGNRWYLWEQMLLADVRWPVSKDIWK